MKINWGTGIAISIIVFTLISLAFIYFAFNQDVNLVRDDYYEAELQFNDRMKVLERTADLDENVRISLDDANLMIKFPDLFKSEIITGTIFLYRPSDRRLDKSLSIFVDSTNTQILNKKELLPGMWKVQLNWSVDTLNYFSEEIIMVN
jgi:nitrogen fixation protein FixH